MHDSGRRHYAVRDVLCRRVCENQSYAVDHDYARVISAHPWQRTLGTKLDVSVH